MAQVISDYEGSTPAALRDLLMGAVQVGDADELHSACIALANIAALQASKISALTGHVNQLENRLSHLEKSVDIHLNPIMP